jgi:hypothetical protein
VDAIIGTHKYQEFGILGHLTPGKNHQAAEKTAREQVDDREDHSAMISAHETAWARRDPVVKPHRFRGGSLDR